MPHTNVGRVFASTVAMALALTSCTGGALHPTASSTIPPGLPPGASTPAPAGPSSSPTDSGVASLNRWILSRTTPTKPDDDLPLGPGDLIVVSVFLVSELSQLGVRIPGNGEIALPLIGILPAAGHTARDIENEVRARLRERYMHDPQVSVFVQEHKSQQIAVFGSVKAGGLFPLVSRLRVTDALAMAGALNEDADHVVYLIRRTPGGPARPHNRPPIIPAGSGEAVNDELMIPIDLESVITESRTANPTLQAGDVIHVPRAGSYYVGGEVMRPGSFLLKGKTTLHQAIVTAGGVKQTADWDDLRVYRHDADGQSKVLKFSLNKLEEREGSDGIEIMKNDVVILGNSNLKSFGYGVLNFIKFGIGASIL